MSAAVEKNGGKFRMVAWMDGYPTSYSLEHVEPNGEVRTLRLFGTEELQDLRYVTERMIELTREPKR